MSADETRVILEAELGLRLANIFDWINLDQPLGSASISQVTAPSCPCLTVKLYSMPSQPCKQLCIGMHMCP